jgi:hypothetical protein
MKETIRIFWAVVAASAIAFGLFFRTEAEKTNRTDVIWLLSLLARFVLGRHRLFR